MTSITIIEELENKIKDYEFKQKFLLKLLNYGYKFKAYNYSHKFRVAKGDIYGFNKYDKTTCDCIDFVSYNDMISKFKNLNYEEYSNLPKKGVLYYLEDGDIIHDGDFKKIYGYLDHETKTLIKLELEYDSDTTSYKFI